MPIDNANVIDVVVQTAPDRLMLVIADPGVITDPEERYRLFTEKLRAYVQHVMSQEFKSEYPLLTPKNVTIRLVSPNKPTEQMAAITHVTPRGDRENQIRVEFEVFKGADERIMLATGESAESKAAAQKRPWWKVWN